VIKLAAPSSSISPQRPQFESSFIARRKSASVTIAGRAFCPFRSELVMTPTTITPTMQMSKRKAILMSVILSGQRV
jgi:hypothetical protein